MRLGNLSRTEIGRQLAAEGIRLRTGPFVLSIRTPIPMLADAIATLYADFPLLDESPFADFHVDVVPRPGLRSFVRPQALFAVGGAVQHDPFRMRLSAAFFEWALNLCITQRTHHYLVLHGAVVERGGRALALLGPSGAGKSTLCAALVLGGWRLLSDELTLIVPDTSMAVPVVRPISLKNKSIGIVRGLDPGATFGPEALTLRKGIVAHMRPPSTSVARMDEHARLTSFVFVRYQPGAPVAWETLPPGIALTEIAKQSFNYGTRGREGFDHLSKLVDECPCAVLTHGGIENAVRAIEQEDAPVGH